MDSRTRPFQTGNRMRTGLSAAGGVQGVNYYVSGEWEDGQGIIRTTSRTRAAFRANLRADLRDDVTVNVTSGYVRSPAGDEQQRQQRVQPAHQRAAGRPWYVEYDPDDMPMARS
jgi:hypothetical protein